MENILNAEKNIENADKWFSGLPKILKPYTIG
jgi:hypothetical protein